MNDDWAIIARGFGIAGLGFVAVMLYILGLSNLYIGFFGVGIGCLVGAGVTTLFFLRVLTPYLDILEARGTEGEEG